MQSVKQAVLVGTAIGASFVAGLIVAYNMVVWPQVHSTAARSERFTYADGRELWFVDLAQLGVACVVAESGVSCDFDVGDYGWPEPDDEVAL